LLWSYGWLETAGAYLNVEPLSMPGINARIGAFATAEDFVDLQADAAFAHPKGLLEPHLAYYKRQR
jgi:hypothetical protein